MTLEKLKEISNGKELFFLKNNYKYRLELFYSGWDGDTVAWVMEDGTLFSTNHGVIEIVSKENFLLYKKQIDEASLELEKVKNMLT